MPPPRCRVSGVVGHVFAASLRRLLFSHVCAGMSSSNWSVHYIEREREMNREIAVARVALL